MIRLVLLAMAFPLFSLAQLQLYLFDGTNETPIGTSYNAGTAAPGDTLEIRFRVRNLSTAAVTLGIIQFCPASLTQCGISQNGFSIEAAPSLPYILAPGAPADFRTAFHPSQTGSYKATLEVNNLTVVVSGTAAPSATLYVAGSSTPLSEGATIDFGSVLRGSSKSQGFLLSNMGATTLKVGVVVGGTGFRGPIGLTAPLQIAPGAAIPFRVVYEPKVGQPERGTLTIDQRTFHLTGQGLDPPLPSASIVFDAQTALSAQQLHVSISLASASQAAGNGTLALEFHPSVAGAADDPAILFLSGPPRVASFTIAAGDSEAKFYGQPNLAFQTGTTAGTLVFTLQLPNAGSQANLTIAAAQITIDAATGVRRVGDLDVSIVGFDNTHSASQLVFTFFDAKGNTLSPGAIRVDETSDFRNYFSTGQFGGSFALRATFPVTGDVNQVAAVEVGLTNSAGTTETQRVPFQ